jgi:hypothetical protein
MILVIVAIGGMSTFGLLSSIVSYQMLAEVNAHLPQELRFSGFGWWLGKSFRLHGEYRRLFPDGKLLIRFWTVSALGYACGLLLVWAALFL